MSENLEITIDINAAGLNLDSEELEAYTHHLLSEVNELAESAYIPRDSEAPKDSKSGEAGFSLGFIKAYVSISNLQKLVDWLGNLFYGKTLELNYEENGTKVTLKYQTAQQLEQQIKAVEQLKNLQIKINNEINS